MKKNLGILGITAVAIALLLSSCSNSSEEATLDTGIVDRLNAATDFSWQIDSESWLDELEKKNLTENELWWVDVYDSKGYIQRLHTTDVMKCAFDVFVFETEELAKSAKAQLFVGENWDDFDGFVGVTDDPLTGYGIILVDYVDPCSVAAASTFDFVLPPKN